MKKDFRQIFLISILLMTLQSNAQISDETVDKMMNRRILTAEEIRYNTAALIPDFYARGKFDTVDALIRYYEDKYCESEMFCLFDILNSIKKGNFHEGLHRDFLGDICYFKPLSDSDFYLSRAFGTLLWYRDFYDIKTSTKISYASIKDIYARYIDFLRKMAKENLSAKILTKEEQLICSYVSEPSDSLLKTIEKDTYKDTRLRRSYESYSSFVSEIKGLHMSLYSGIWSPTGHLGILGDHPYTGMSMGGRTRNFLIDLNCNFGYLRCPQNYSVAVNNVNYTTDYYFGVYFGIDAGYSFVRENRHELSSVISIGYCLFSPFSSTSSSDSLVNISITSLDMSLGLGYKYYYKLLSVEGDQKRSTYLSFQVRYHLNNYDNPNGTSLSGNSWTACLIWGGFSNKVKRFEP